MPRILADLALEDIDWLDRLAAEQGKSRAAILRQAVAAYRNQSIGGIEHGFGLWKRHGFDEDGLSFQRDRRKSR